MNFKREF